MSITLFFLFFQGAKLEIESVLREVCERLLSSPPPSASRGGHDMVPSSPISREKLHKRAAALQIMGEVSWFICSGPLYLTKVGPWVSPRYQ